LIPVPQLELGLPQTTLGYSFIPTDLHTRWKLLD
jgi:hypothetical protein